MNRDVIRELIWFAAINIGISLAMRAGHALWPEGPFRTELTYLIVVGVMLSLNFYRSFQAPRWRIVYVAIAVLNVYTHIAMSSLAFLTTLGEIYRLREALICMLLGRQCLVEPYEIWLAP